MQFLVWSGPFTARQRVSGMNGRGPRGPARPLRAPAVAVIRRDGPNRALGVPLRAGRLPWGSLTAPRVLLFAFAGASCRHGCPARSSARDFGRRRVRSCAGYTPPAASITLGAARGPDHLWQAPDDRSPSPRSRPAGGRSLPGSSLCSLCPPLCPLCPVVGLVKPALCLCVSVALVRPWASRSSIPERSGAPRDYTAGV